MRAYTERLRKREWRSRIAVPSLTVRDFSSGMSYVHKARLINKVAFTCAFYFNKMVICSMKILQSKKKGPFDKYPVLCYCKRIEFQHTGIKILSQQSAG